MSEWISVATAIEPCISIWETRYKPRVDWYNAMPPRWKLFKYIRWRLNMPKEG